MCLPLMDGGISRIRKTVFQNDEAIAEFMGLRDGIPLVDHKVGFVMELEQTAYFGENTKSSSLKSKNKERSLGENHTVVPPNHKIVKTKMYLMVKTQLWHLRMEDLTFPYHLSIKRNQLS